MQIDSLGEVLIPPKRIVNWSRIDTAESTAVAPDGPGRLQVWILGGFPRNVYRALVSKRNLSLISLKKTNLETETDAAFIDVTQRPSENFLSLGIPASEAQLLTGFGIGSNGSLDKNGWSLSSTPFGTRDRCWGVCGGGISTDGKGAFILDRSSLEHTRLFVQKLSFHQRDQREASSALSMTPFSSSSSNGLVK